MNRMNSKLISIQMLAIVLVQIFAVTAFATPVNSNATSQEWLFPAETTTMTMISPDNQSNPNGSPFCWIGGRATYYRGPAGGLTAWALNTDEMDFFIPNNPALQARKEMQITIDWMAGSGQTSLPGWPKQPLLSVYPEYAPPNNGKVVSPVYSFSDPTLIPGTTFFRTVVGVVIEPNPVDEWVILKGDIIVDRVAISTICIPEPATLGLLIGGAFMAIRRSRKIKD